MSWNLVVEQRFFIPLPPQPLIDSDFVVCGPSWPYYNTTETVGNSYFTTFVITDGYVPLYARLAVDTNYLSQETSIYTINWEITSPGKHLKGTIFHFEEFIPVTTWELHIPLLEYPFTGFKVSELTSDGDYVNASYTETLPYNTVVYKIPPLKRWYSFCKMSGWGLIARPHPLPFLNLPYNHPILRGVV